MEDAARVGHRELALTRDAVPQRLARDIGHDVIEQVVVRARGEDRENVGMLQVRGELDLLLESGGADFARELGWEQLDHDLTVERCLVRQEQAAHPAPAQLLLDPVRVAERGLEAGEEVGHGRLR